jgi:hypothetical protein
MSTNQISISQLELSKLLNNILHAEKQIMELQQTLNLKEEQLRAYRSARR